MGPAGMIGNKQGELIKVPQRIAAFLLGIEL